ncbi:beta-ketoacyl synthase domain-containing protein [Coniochaeta sp. 2T2.1]|nr:beta-ketoacyl synthase domain-containing protein [Coniochaeta sp. 2T2.1]
MAPTTPSRVLYFGGQTLNPAVDTSLFSCSTGNPYPGPTVAELFPYVVADIFEHKLLDGKAVESALHGLGKESETTVDIFGPAGANVLKRAAEQAGLKEVKIRTVESPTSPETVSSAGIDIAIVGMAGQFPGAEDLEGFWDLLKAGKDVHRQAPKSRFDTDLHLDKSGQTKNSTLSAYGCWLDNPGAFDHRLFNMSPREAQQTDPVHRLLLMTTYEALEVAGYPGADYQGDAERIGSFVSMTADDWREYNASQDIGLYFVTGGLRAFAAGRLNYFFKWEGPSFTVDTACSSGAAAVQLACQSLLEKDCDVAVVGGANILTGPNLYAGLSRAGFTSPTGSSKTFDETADGYCRGEAVGVIVLKRLDHALARRDNILGVIRSVETNHSAHAPSITQPHSPAQQSLYAQALRRAGLKPNEIGYVEAHGTGTQAGDTKEMDSIYSTFAEGRTPDNPLYVGGVKANVGHGESGGNTCVILEEPPRLTEGSEDAVNRTHHVVTLSGKTQPSLDGNRQRLLDYLRSHPDARLQDVAYTTTSRRMHHPLRTAISVSSVDQLVRTLSQSPSTPSSSSARSKVVFMFPGQGLRLAGSAKVLYETCLPFKDVITELEGLVKALDLPSFMHVLIDTESDTTAAGPVVTQLAIVALEIALARVLKLWGITPDAVVGHSLGEYAALCVAGVLSVSDTLYLVGKRAELVEKLCAPGTHGMLAVTLSADQCRNIIRNGQGDAAACVVACINGPRSTVVSGTQTELDAFQALVNNHNPGTKCTKVGTGYAFHSPQLDPVLEPYRQVASTVKFSSSEVPVASTLLGNLVNNDGNFSASYLVDHARQPVQFDSAIRALEKAGLADGSSLLIETGPDTMCLSMARGILQHSGELLPCLKPSADVWDTVANLLSKAYTRGLSVNWVEYNKPYESSLEFLDLPLYHFEKKDFWITYEGGVTKLQKEVDELKLRLEQVAAAPSISPAAVASDPVFISSCLHTVEKETISKDRSTVVFKTDIQKKPLRALIAGHNVIGVLLAPSSIYNEMAYAAIGYVYSRLYPGKESPAVELNDFVISAPLILSQNPGPQVVEISVDLNAAEGVATVRVSSNKEHARCSVVLLDGGERWTQDRKHYLLHERVQSLTDPNSPTIHRLWRDMVYKIFTPVTDYDKAYWSIAGFFVQHDFMEAALQLDLRETPADCSFNFDPVWLDGIAQAAGFMLNSNPAKPDDTLYVSTGLESMRVSRALAPGKQYYCHVRARADPVNDATFYGDVTILDDTKVLAVADGLVFKRVKKTHLLAMFGQPSREAKPASSTLPATTPKPAPVASTAPTTTSTRREKQRSPPQPKMDTQLSAVLALIADEVGTAVAELTDESTLDSLGVDSLLTVSITTRVKNELDIDLPATLMLGETTIADLRAALRGGGSDVDGSFNNNDYTDDESSDGTPPSTASASTTSSGTPLPAATPITPPQESPLRGLLDGFVGAVADETGTDAHLIEDHTLLSELGVDSLMSMSIISTVQERTGVELPASLLTDCATLAEVKKELMGIYGVPDGVVTPESSRSSHSPTPTPAPKQQLDINSFRSNVVLLQGNPRSGRPKLFLISEGSGSAAAYIHLPKFDTGVVVYGLDSPFLHCPEHFNCSMEEVCTIFRRAIQSVQPHGPYLVGGWSIGGMYAYETTRQLVAVGERVEGLLLIDSACPRRLVGIPRITVDICEETGMFLGFESTGKKQKLTPEQKVHVTGCVRSAAEYEPEPIPEPGRPTHAYVIWSRFGMFDKLSLKVKEVGERIAEEQGLEKTGVNQDWLTAERTEFGPKGWDKLLGPVETFALDGDHFSIMMLPKGEFDSMTTLRAKLDKEEGCDHFMTKVYPQQKRLVIAYTVEAFAKLGCALADLPAGSPVSVSGVLPKQTHTETLNAMYEILEDGGLITRSPNANNSSSAAATRTSQAVDPTPAADLQQSIVRDFPPHAVTHQLLHVTASQLAECLTGKANPMHLVFGLNRSLIQDFYTNAPMFLSASRHLSEFLRHVYTAALAATKQTPGQPFELLEVGAGLGGTAAHILNMLAAAGIPFRYTYTDISPSLVAAAKKRFTSMPGNKFGEHNMDFLTLDVTDPVLPPHLLGRFHTVLSTNCVHATPDLTASTTNMRRMLRADGFMALVELTTRLYWFDLVFGFFDGWWLFVDGRRHALADTGFWEGSLRGAGFGEVTWLDEDAVGGTVNPQLILAFNNRGS